MPSDKPCLQAVWNVLSLGDKVLGTIVAKNPQDAYNKAKALYGSKIRVQDSGRKKPCCKDCGKKQ